MPNNAKKAKLMIESGVTLNAMSALTTTDRQVFKHATVGLFSEQDDYAPAVRPDGVINGGVVTPDTVNDQIDVAALNLWLAGVKTAVAAAASESITRGTSNGYIQNAVTINSGGAVAIVAGTEHASAHNDTPGTAGGPPYIPVGSVLVRMIKLTSITPALVLASEIYDVPGQHVEYYDYPGAEVQLSDDVDDPTSVVKFDSVLPAVHTGDLAKGVFAEVYEPTGIAYELVSDFVPPDESDSVSSVEVYNKTLGTESTSLNGGSFSIKLNDGITDQIVKKKGQRLWFWFYPNRDKEPYEILNGKLSMTRSYPVADFIQANCTISPQSVGKGISS